MEGASRWLSRSPRFKRQCSGHRPSWSRPGFIPCTRPPWSACCGGWSGRLSGRSTFTRSTAWPPPMPPSPGWRPRSGACPCWRRTRPSCIPLEVRLDRAEARADAAAGDIARLDKTAHAPPPDTARLEALEAGIHALRDARRPAIEQETARLDRIERRLDGLEIWADGHRHQLARMDATRHDDMARLVTLYTRFRSDLLAIGNRHAWVEERTAAAAEVAEQMRPLREGLFLTATPQRRVPAESGRADF